MASRTRGLVSEDQKTKDDEKLIVTSHSESSSDVEDFSKRVDRIKSSKIKHLKITYGSLDVEIYKFKEVFSTRVKKEEKYNIIKKTVRE